MGALGRLDAGDPRHGEDVALGMAAVLDQLQGFRAHAHHGLGRGFTGGHGLFRDVDHVGAALGIEMGQHVGAPGRGYWPVIVSPGGHDAMPGGGSEGG